MGPDGNCAYRADDTPPDRSKTGRVWGETRDFRRRPARNLIFMMSPRGFEDGHRAARAQNYPTARAAGKKPARPQAARADAWFYRVSPPIMWAGCVGWGLWTTNTPPDRRDRRWPACRNLARTMVRVHEGLPARPLPMAHPAPPANTPKAPNAQPRNNKQKEKEREQLLLNVPAVDF